MGLFTEWAERRETFNEMDYNQAVATLQGSIYFQGRSVDPQNLNLSMGQLRQVFGDNVQDLLRRGIIQPIPQNNPFGSGTRSYTLKPPTAAADQGAGAGPPEWVRFGKYEQAIQALKGSNYHRYSTIPPEQMSYSIGQLQKVFGPELNTLMKLGIVRKVLSDPNYKQTASYQIVPPGR